jgi:hypothetical protein
MFLPIKITSDADQGVVLGIEDAVDDQAQFQRLVCDYVRELAAAGAADPDILAQRLMLLMEGAIVMAHVCGDKGAAAQAKSAAEALLDHAAIR